MKLTKKKDGSYLLIIIHKKCLIMQRRKSYNMGCKDGERL